MLLLVLDFVFFSRYSTHQDLHSFPTRRSSDLARSECPIGRVGPNLSSRCQRANTARIVRSVTAHATSARYMPRWWRGRSEEHTSELQSLTNLVCRLLLEKKKYKK